MVTVLRDVTDLRRADEELRSNYDKLRQAEEVVRQDRDRLNLIIENVGDPIMVCDRDAKVVLLDPLAQDLLGSENSRARAAHAQPGEAGCLRHEVHLLLFRPGEHPIQLTHPEPRIRRWNTTRARARSMTSVAW